MKRLTAEAEALCRAVAPDLARGPLYVLLRSELSAELRVGHGLLGLTTRHLDLILRPTLERLGRWCGRGPAMLIDPAALAAGSAHRDRSARWRAFKPAFLGIVLHELAHVLDADLTSGPEPDPDLVVFARLAFEAELKGTIEPTNGPGTAIPWRRHEWRFIRIALHWAHRATRVGVPLTPLDVFDAAEYGLSPTWEYAAALGDEPERMASLDFAAIRSAAVPAAFAGVWRRDLLRWLLPARSREQLSEALAACGRRIHIPKVARKANHQTERQGSRC
jgi:hypothetical protein